MTRASLRPYLNFIPLFKYLLGVQQRDIAGRLATRRLARGETLDLRGSRANVLCIVTSGRVTVESRCSDDRIRRSELDTGQWIGQALITGWHEAHMTRLRAENGDAHLLLLWRQDLSAVRSFESLQLWMLLVRRPKALLQRAGRTVTGVPKRVSARISRHDVTVGVLIAMVIFVGYLFFTPPGRSLQADWRYLGVAHEFRLSPGTLTRLLSSIISLASDHPSAMVEMGNLAMQSGDPQVASQRYALVSDESAAAANNLGVILLERGKPAAARQYLIASAQREPDVALAYQNMGIIFQQLGQGQQALRAFKEAMGIDPALTTARYYVGLHHLNQGALEEASGAFLLVLEQVESCAPAYLGLGLALMENGDLQAAAQALSQATRLDPDSVVSHFYLGWTLTRLGSQSQAEAALKQVLLLHTPRIYKGGSIFCCAKEQERSHRPHLREVCPDKENVVTRDALFFSLSAKM